MSEPYIVSQTLKYSDGSEKVVQFTQNVNAEVIEKASAEMVEDNQLKDEEPLIVPANEIEEVHEVLEE